MDASPGKRLGRYEIRSMIGRGGMGEVYLGHDTQLRRPVALKLLAPQFTDDEDRLRRFEQEACAASALNHPNIITIYEIREIDSIHFIVTEFIDGDTLRQHITSTAIKPAAALDIATQVASALAAAHHAGIVHRDIKPENIMLRRDGYVKVLDFGLAKLTEQTAHPGAATLVDTESGTVMGTVSYMSPEQARGIEVDARTDIWSLGAVLYEIVTGRLPVEGSTTSEMLASILSDKEPQPMARYAREVPIELERIVMKALRKNREERYQTVKDLLLDLKSLKQRLEFEAELERSVTPEIRDGVVGATNRAQALTMAANQSVAGAAGAGAAYPKSIGKYAVSGVKLHQKSTFIVISALVIASTAAVYLYTRPARALSEKDTILLADFVNTTGDAVLDGTLKQALAAQLEQSPFLNIFPDERVREALQYMGRSPDERLDKDVAREICQRHGIKALLTGSISNIGSHYVISLEAISSSVGDVLAREQVEAETKERILRALGQAASNLRARLGEALSSIQKFDSPVEQVTTPSLEALKAFSLGKEMQNRGIYLNAIPYFKRAIELDPNFALAYTMLEEGYYNTKQFELAGESAEKAFERRDRVSEREKFYISAAYYEDVTGEIDKAIEVYEMWKRTYPRDDVPPNNQANDYLHLGRYEKAIEEAREAIRRDPNDPVHYQNMATAFQHLNRFDEAKEVLEQALSQKADAASIHSGRYQISFLQGDSAAMKQEIDWFSGAPAQQYVGEALQAQAAENSGQLRKARNFYTRSIDLTQRPNMNELAARFASFSAVSEAMFGNCKQASEESTKALAIARSRQSLVSVAYALALCGEINRSQTLVDELAKRYPKRVLLIATWLPIIRAEIEIQRHNPAKAIELLQATAPYEMGLDAGLVPAYIRGQAYLMQGAGAEAMDEFQKILDHPGTTTFSTLYPPLQYPLGHIGLARAAAISSDISKSRKAYEDFFALWKDADPDLPILQQARQEYDKLK